MKRKLSHQHIALSRIFAPVVIALALVLPVVFFTQNNKITVGSATVFAATADSGNGNGQNSGHGINQDSGPTAGNTSTRIENPLANSVTSIPDFVQAVLSFFLKVGIPLIAFFIIYAGLQFVLAQGNTEKLEKAKRTFLYTIIGGGLLLGAWTISLVVQETIGAIVAK
jgi:hypothetical protein